MVKPIIVSENLRKNDPLPWMDTYRVRLVDHSILPVLSDYSLLHNHNIYLVDLPDAVKVESIDEDKENIYIGTPKKEQSSEEFELAGSPLKYEFLTLDKLREQAGDDMAMIGARRVSDDRFPLNGISVQTAKELRQCLVHLDSPIVVGVSPSSATTVIFSCDASDESRTIFVGLQRCQTGLRLFDSKCPGAIDAEGKEELNVLTGRIPTIFNCKGETKMQYQILGQRLVTNLVEDEQRRGCDATSSITVDYPAKPGDVAVPPPSSARATLHFTAGWCDKRLQYNDRAYQLSFMLAMANALKNNTELDWNSASKAGAKADAEIVAGVRKLIQDSGKEINESKEGNSVRFLDFTERLWDELSGCRSKEVLIKSFQVLFSALRSKSVNTILHEDNDSRLARLVRDSCKGAPVHLPTLDGRAPVELLLEIAVERFRRDLVELFVSRSYVSSEEEVKQLMERGRKEKDMEKNLNDDAYVCQAALDTLSLIPLFISLQTVSHLGEVLQFDHKHEMRNRAKEVLTQFTSSSRPSYSYETRVPLVAVQKHIRDRLPAKFSTECVYSLRGEERVRTHLLISRTPPVKYLEGLYSGIEVASEQYSVIYSTWSSVAYKSNPLLPPQSVF